MKPFSLYLFLFVGLNFVATSWKDISQNTLTEDGKVQMLKSQY